MVGLVLYISSINDEMLNRTKDAETYFNYKYGWSFAFAAISFLLTEVNTPLHPPLPPQGGGRGAVPGLSGETFTSTPAPPTLVPFVLPRMCYLRPSRGCSSRTPLLCPPTHLSPVPTALCRPQPESKAKPPAGSSPLLSPHCRVLG